MLTAEGLGEISCLKERDEGDDVPAPVYHTLNDGDQIELNESGSTLEYLCRAPAADDDVEPRYRAMDVDCARGHAGTDDNAQIGVAQVIGSASRCVVTTAAGASAAAAAAAAAVGTGAPSGRSQASQPKMVFSAKAKLLLIAISCACLFISIYAHFSSAKADLFKEEVERLRKKAQHQMERVALLEREKQDLANLLLHPQAKHRLYNMMARSKAFNRFVRRYGFESTPNTTKNVRQCLAQAFVRLNVQSVLDVPCGDGSWQHLVAGIDSVTYVGADINPKALEMAKRRQDDSHPYMEFMLFDAVDFPLRRAFDLVLFRDIVEQQPIADTLTALLNFKSSGSGYIAASYWPHAPRGANGDGYALRHAGWYQTNLLQEPFSFPQPLWSCDNVESESPYHGLSKLGFWRLEDLPVTAASVREARDVGMHLGPGSGQPVQLQEDDTTFSDILKFFGAPLMSTTILRPQRSPVATAIAGDSRGSAMHSDPFNGLFSDWLERSGPVRPGLPSRRPGLLSQFFEIPAFDPNDR